MTHSWRFGLLSSGVVVLGVLLAGCGSDSGADAASEAAGDTATGAAADASVPSDATGAGAEAVGDACDLLTGDEASAVLGYAAEGQSMGAPGEAYSLSACTWGGADKGTYLALQVLSPGAVADPLGLLLGASGQTPAAYPALPDGQQWELGFLPGGGGVGQTITWAAGQDQVALSLLGDAISSEQQQALQVAAGQVDAALDG
jgi:hypothetical protein